MSLPEEFKSESIALLEAERVFDRINTNLNRLAKLVQTTEEQRVPLMLIERQRELDAQGRRVIDTIKIPPSIQIVIWEVASLEMQRLAMERRGFHDIGVVTTNSLGAQVHLADRYLQTWARIVIKNRPRVAQAIYSGRAEYFYAGKWLMYVVAKRR